MKEKKFLDNPSLLVLLHLCVIWFTMLLNCIQQYNNKLRSFFMFSWMSIKPKGLKKIRALGYYVRDRSQEKRLHFIQSQFAGCCSDGGCRPLESFDFCFFSTYNHQLLNIILQSIFVISFISTIHKHLLQLPILMPLLLLLLRLFFTSFFHVSVYSFFFVLRTRERQTNEKILGASLFYVCRCISFSN